MEKSTIPVKRACIAGAAGAAITLLLTFALALCSSRMLLPQGREGVLVRAALFLASVCSALMACRKQSANRAACAAISGGVILAFVLILAVIAKNSSVINISLLFNFLCVIFGVLLGCLLTVKPKKRRKRR